MIRRRLLIVALALFAVVAVGGILFATHWPFTRRAVIESLTTASSGRVEIGQFYSRFFPYPGCVAEDVVIHRPNDPAGTPLVTVSRLTVRGDYARLLTLSKNLNFVHTDGMHIRIRAGKRQAARGGTTPPGAQLSIDTLVADRTTLEFDSDEPGKPPFVIAIHHTRLSPVSSRRALNFETDLRIPTPPGEIHSTGQFGPWDMQDPFGTPVSGSYKFHHADLAFARGIAGILESQGGYRGSIRRVDVTDAAVVPDFRVASTNHPVGLTARFQATVNGETGDTVLHKVDAHFGHTEVIGRGKVAADTADAPKTVSLALSVPRGRIDDFLYLLDQDARPAMVGDFRAHTQVVLPGNEEPFLKKLRMNGEFQITRGRFTAPSTEESLDRIRDHSRGEPTDYDSDVLSNLRGTARVAEGVARLSAISFEVPGASARLSGTYNLLSTYLDLGGMTHLDTSLSSAATGVKSFLLRLLNPFFKSRRRKGSDVPIKITGFPGNTSVSLDTGKKHDRDREAARKTGR